MRKSSLIQGAVILSFSKKIVFPVPPVGFTVKSVAFPPVSKAEAQSQSSLSYESGKKEATDFYLGEIQKLREEYAESQKSLLATIQDKAERTIDELSHRLPDLVVGVVERILPQIELGKSEVEQIARSLINDFSSKDEKLEVYLCPEDMKLLRGMGKSSSEDEVIDNGEDDQGDGFASAIAGIFDNLDGEDALLPDLPNVMFFEDPTLARGDCQIKSRFGLLDGRIATKLRKIEEELKGNG